MCVPASLNDKTTSIASIQKPQTRSQQALAPTIRVTNRSVWQLDTTEIHPTHRADP